MLKLIRRRTEKGQRGEKGQALVEFALLVPIFLMLLFAIVDFGMGFHSWITVTNSAREGARLGAVAGTEQQIIDRVHDTATLINEETNMDVLVTNAQGLPGESVVVQVDYDYDLITPLASLVAFLTGDIIGPTLTLSSTAEMRLE
ncbi:MAG: pilus assembly protein [Chloroflexi bacterium]|nr:pilus assembly protein [Chloroflexota bacterium]